MATFSLPIVKFIPKSIGFRPLMRKINCASFTKIYNILCRLYRVNKKMQVFNLNWLLFPY